MKYIIIVFAVLLLFGCLSQPEQGETPSINTEEQGENISGSIVVVNESEETPVNEDESEVPLPEQPPQEPAEIMDYEENVDAELSINFFDVSTPAKHGRLIVISKSDFDAVIYSVPKEQFNVGLAQLESYVDDAELFIVPSATQTSIDSVKDAIDRVLIGKLVVPKYDDENLNAIKQYAESKGIDVVEVQAGDVLEYNGIQFEVLGPYPGELTGPNNNAVVIRLKDRDFKMTFFTDSTEGEMQKIMNTFDDLSSTIIEVPNYGVDFTPTAPTLYFDKAKPEVLILDGYREDVTHVGPTDPRQFFEEYVKIRKLALYKVWVNKKLKVVYNGQTYGVV